MNMYTYYIRSNKKDIAPECKICGCSFREHDSLSHRCPDNYEIISTPVKNSESTSYRQLLRRSLFLLKTQLNARSGESINLISKIEDYLKTPNPELLSTKAIVDTWNKHAVKNDPYTIVIDNFTRDIESQVRAQYETSDD